MATTKKQRFAVKAKRPVKVKAKAKAPAKRTSHKRAYAKPTVTETMVTSGIAAGQKVSSDPTQLAVREVASTSAMMKASVELLKVDSQESALDASRMLVSLKSARQQVEQKRKFLTGPLREHIKRIDAMFKPHADLLEEADQLLRTKLLGYQTQQAEKARTEQAKLLAEAEQAQAAGNGNAALALATTASQLGLSQSTQHVEDGSVQSKKVWTFEVEDLGKVPNEYFTLDETKVRAAIRAGVREVPGLRIFQKEQLAVSMSVPMGAMVGSLSTSPEDDF